MIALDTNVLVRVVTRDDPEQLEAALRVMRADALWVSKTVLLELEWVLRYSYELDRKVIHQTFARLFGLRSLRIEDRTAVLRAHNWHGEGMDFADALHLSSSQRSERFVTFDRKLAKAAKRLDGSVKIERLQ